MKRIIKRFSALLTGLAVVLAFCFFVIPERDEKTSITALAEEVVESREEYYENENLFFVGSVSDYRINSFGVGFQISDFVLSGINLDSAISFVINLTKIPVLSLTEITFSADFDGLPRFLVCFYDSSDIVITGSVGSGWFFNSYYNAFCWNSSENVAHLSIPSNAVSMCFGVCFYSSTLPFGQRFSVSNYMISIGDTVKPYQPSFQDIYNNGYDKGEQAGHDSGYQSGYDQGVADTSDTLDLGVFRNCTFSAVLTYGDDSVINVTDFVPGFTYNSVLTKKLWDSYMVKPGDDSVYLEICELTINFAEYFNYATFPVYFSGASVVTDATFIDSSGNRYSAQITPWQSEQALAGDYYRILVSDTNVSTFQVTSLTVRFGRASDTLESGVFSAMSGSYLVGYDSGYNSGLVDGKSEGLSQGREEGYQSGYDSGYDSGYATGKADAFSQINNSSLAESVRAFMFSLFDAPVSTFLGAFNFSWDAFDIGSLVAFIFTMIVIIGFVKVWL